MSGTYLKLFSIFLFSALVAGICLVPGSDCSSSADNPYTGISTDAYAAFLGNESTYYVVVGSPVTIYGFIDDEEYVSVKTVTSGFGLSIIDDTAVHSLVGNVSKTGTITVTALNAEINGSLENTYSITIHVVAAPEEEPDSPNTFEEETEGNALDTSVVDTAAENMSSDEKSYTPTIALIIVVVLFIGILLLLRKVI